MKKLAEQLWAVLALMKGLRYVVTVCCFIQVSLVEAAAVRDDVAFFIANMAERHAMNPVYLRALLGELKPVAAIMKAASAPSTSRPWHEYRPIMVEKSRIEGGVKFWRSNEALLRRAREIYGVPESVIVAIVGVETRFGKVVGGHRVLDALYTLAFELPGRNEYFKSELEAFLLLAQEQGWDPTTTKGSYAGAMGMPQFMPNSYRKYAVDFDGDGKVELWTNMADVIGSVAAFLHQFGWRRDEQITQMARIEASDLQSLLSMGLKPHTSIAQWRLLGVSVGEEGDDQQMAALFTLDTTSGPEYWLAYENFNVLLQYNRSRNYAMSVHQLAREIVRERERLSASASLIGH